MSPSWSARSPGSGRRAKLSRVPASFMEAQMHYWFRHLLSKVARFSLCLSFACILFGVLSPLTFMLLARVIPEETLQAMGGFIVLALIALVLIVSAVTTEALWRWIGARSGLSSTALPDGKG